MSSSNAPSISTPAVGTPPSEQTVAIDYDNPQHEKWSPAFRRLILPDEVESRSARMLTWGLAFVIAGLYLFLLLGFWAPAHPGVDQNGYFVGGRQFAETFSTGINTQSDFEFIGRMWIRAETGENFPKYPLGLPILFAVCIWLQPVWNWVSWDGHDVAHLISPVSAALATLGVFAFVGRIAGGFAGLLAMLVLGLSQVMLTLAINPNSHALGTCLTVWGFYLMIRWLETGALWRGMLCGFILGYAYLVRYTEGLQALPLGIAMLYAAVWWRPGWMRAAITGASVILFVALAYAAAKVWGDTAAAGGSWLAPLAEDNGKPYKAIVGLISVAAIVSIFIHIRSLWRLLLVGFAWLVPVLYQTLFNMVEMHTFTSYAGTNESTGFSMDYFQYNWEKMIRVLNDQGLFFIAPIGFVGLLVMFRKMPLLATILALWFLPSVLLYTAYYWAPDQWGVAYSRFVLTELPALVISAAWLLGMLVRTDYTAQSIPRVTFFRPLAGALLVAAGLAVTILVWLSYSPSRDAIWWATAAPAMVFVVLGLSLVACVWSGARPMLIRQLANPVPRIAIGAAAFVACAIGSYRCIQGTEWGQRINARANIQAQSFENKNLATLGKTARAAIPPGSVVFADGERLHHLQWLSTWQTFAADAFNPETVRRLLYRSSKEETEPDPIDPGRLKFLREAYAKKDQADLTSAQNAIMEEAILSGRRVFLVLSNANAKAFVKKFVDSSSRKKSGMVFTTRQDAFTDRVNRVYEAVLPRDSDAFLEPDERPKAPVGRGGTRLAIGAFGEKGRSDWRIVEILEKPMTPTTKPTNNPSTGKPETLVDSD